jgi:formiminoglutamase
MSSSDDSPSECRGWTSAADLVGDYPDATVALIGAPLAERSLTPGRCDLAPKTVRATLPRMSVYDVESGVDLSAMRVHDAGDLNLKLISPADALAPVRDAVAEQAKARTLTILLGGNNAVTRPGVHGLDASLQRAGVLTLDAHFDLRDTDCGLTNGNPIQALLDDGFDGRRISQIGLAPFANTKKMHDKAKAAGVSVRTLRNCREAGVVTVVSQELQRLSTLCDMIYVDFDIDVIDRAQMPGAPGARAGGMAAHDFFDATRLIGRHPLVRAVDLTEFDPSLDVNDLGALTAARWFVELLAGFSMRGKMS